MHLDSSSVRPAGNASSCAVVNGVMMGLGRRQAAAPLDAVLDLAEP